MIKGITISLLETTKTGVDAFNHDVYAENWVNVENVLVAPLSETEILETVNLTGRKCVYQLGIPKGDAHKWENVRVRFFGEEFRTVGAPIKGIDELIPLSWNAKVRVERYE